MSEKMILGEIFMPFLKTITALCLLSITFSSYADELSKKACTHFLPAFGDNNIDIINNGLRKDVKSDDAFGKKFFEVLKVVSDDVSIKAQERCDKGIYPIMDLDNCAKKCNAETTRIFSGSNRNYTLEQCYRSCTGAYVAQGAITRTIRKLEVDNTQCGSTMNIFDSKKSKQIEGILHNTDSSDSKPVLPK